MIKSPKIVNPLSETIIITFCIFWWFIAKDIPDFILPEPLEVLSALFQLAVNLESFQHIAISMFRVTGALIFAAIVSITLAILCYSSPLYFWGAQTSQSTIKSDR